MQPEPQRCQGEPPAPGCDTPKPPPAAQECPLPCDTKATPRTVPFLAGSWQDIQENKAWLPIRGKKTPCVFFLFIYLKQLPLLLSILVLYTDPAEPNTLLLIFRGKNNLLVLQLLLNLPRTRLWKSS